MPDLSGLPRQGCCRLLDPLSLCFQFAACSHRCLFLVTTSCPPELWQLNFQDPETSINRSDKPLDLSPYGPSLWLGVTNTSARVDCPRLTRAVREHSMNTILARSDGSDLPDLVHARPAEALLGLFAVQKGGNLSRRCPLLAHSSRAPTSVRAHRICPHAPRDLDASTETSLLPFFVTPAPHPVVVFIPVPSAPTAAAIASSRAFALGFVVGPKPGMKERVIRRLQTLVAVMASRVIVGRRVIIMQTETLPDVVPRWRERRPTSHHTWPRWRTDLLWGQRPHTLTWGHRHWRTLSSWQFASAPTCRANRHAYHDCSGTPAPFARFPNHSTDPSLSIRDHSAAFYPWLSSADPLFPDGQRIPSLEIQSSQPSPRRTQPELSWPARHQLPSQSRQPTATSASRPRNNKKPCSPRHPELMKMVQRLHSCLRTRARRSRSKTDSPLGSADARTCIKETYR